MSAVTGNIKSAFVWKRVIAKSYQEKARKKMWHEDWDPQVTISSVLKLMLGALIRSMSLYQESEWGQSVLIRPMHKKGKEILEFLKCKLTFTCIFTCLHTYIHDQWNPTYHLEINLTSGLIPESFTKCNFAKNGDKRALWAHVRSNACWANLIWTFLCLYLTPKIHCSSLVAQPSSFRF